MGRTWVSKSELVAYIKCPYTFWRLHSGQISFEDTYDQTLARLLKKQLARRVDADRDLPLLEVSEDRPDVPGREGLILDPVTIFKNPDQGILGRPQGIRVVDGRWYPMVVSDPEKVTRTHKLTLAFYWLVLAPYSRPVRRQRVGFVTSLVEKLGWREVSLEYAVFQQLKVLLEGVRKAKREGVRPRFCKCYACRELPRETLISQALANRDLLLIHDISWGFGTVLEAEGISTYDALLKTNSEPIQRKLRKYGLPISLARIEAWKHHARAYETNLPVVFGKEKIPFEEMAVVDFEYGSHIWLIGVRIHTRDRDRDYFLWADGPSRERANIGKLWEIVRKTNLPVVTWAGTMAELPRLRDAMRRLGAQGFRMDDLRGMHFDGYEFVRRNLRLPIPDYSLKEIARYFSIARASKIVDGLQANELYERYRTTRGPKRQRIKERLKQYNRDDLDSTLSVVQSLKRLLGP